MFLLRITLSPPKSYVLQQLVWFMWQTENVQSFLAFFLPVKHNRKNWRKKNRERREKKLEASLPLSHKPKNHIKTKKHFIKLLAISAKQEY